VNVLGAVDYIMVGSALDKTYRVLWALPPGDTATNRALVGLERVDHAISRLVHTDKNRARPLADEAAFRVVKKLDLLEREVWEEDSCGSTCRRGLAVGRRMSAMGPQLCNERAPSPFEGTAPSCVRWLQVFGRVDRAGSSAVALRT
jgi:hypothetical protein